MWIHRYGLYKVSPLGGSVVKNHPQFRSCRFDPWVQCPCLENPMHRGAWQAQSMGSHRDRRAWSDSAPSMSSLRLKSLRCSGTQTFMWVNVLNNTVWGTLAYQILEAYADTDKGGTAFMQENQGNYTEDVRKDPLEKRENSMQRVASVRTEDLKKRPFGWRITDDVCSPVVWIRLWKHISVILKIGIASLENGQSFLEKFSLPLFWIFVIVFSDINITGSWLNYSLLKVCDGRFWEYSYLRIMPGKEKNKSFWFHFTLILCALFIKKKKKIV